MARDAARADKREAFITRFRSLQIAAVIVVDALPISWKKENMEQQHKKMLAIACLAVCAICIAVAVERYKTNANNVRAINAMQQSMPFGSTMGGGRLKPAVPTASKYAAGGAVVTGIGGVVLLVAGARREA